MDKRTIIFRADGSPILGMGHFIRTLALAEMLKDDFYCIYATKSPSAYQINEIEQVCHDKIDLPSDETHFNNFLEHLKGNEIVVLDNYYFTTKYQILIKNKGCKLVCIDDIHDKHFVADLIINHAEGISESQYSVEKYTKFCLGFQYALLRKDHLTNDEEQTKKKYGCLVMMGGADPFNLIAKIISMIDPLHLSLPVAVIIGAGSENETMLKRFNNILLFKGIPSSKVFQLMQESKLGVFPASTVAIEACAARLPFICGYYVDNQKEIYNGIKQNNLAYCIGDFQKSNTKVLSKAFDSLSRIELKEEMIEKQKSFLDKNSKERFINVFRNLWN